MRQTDSELALLRGVCHSLSELIRAPDGVQWMQVNVAFAPTGQPLSAARRLFDTLISDFDEAQRRGRIHSWFFMRKPPDLRLRFCVDAGQDVLAEEIDRQITILQDQGLIREYWWSNYAAEVERFGGAPGMNEVHAYFHADSWLWLALDRLERTSRRSVAAEQLLPAVFQNLFTQQGNHVAMLEGWRHLSELIAERALPDPHPVEVGDSPGLTQWMHSGVLDAQERLIIKTYVTCGARFYDRLAALERMKVLTRPIPKVLAEVALFVFNRHGFGGDRSAPLVERAFSAALTGVTEKGA